MGQKNKSAKGAEKSNGEKEEGPGGPGKGAPKPLLWLGLGLFFLIVIGVAVLSTSPGDAVKKGKGSTTASRAQKKEPIKAPEYDSLDEEDVPGDVQASAAETTVCDSRPAIQLTTTLATDPPLEVAAGKWSTVQSLHDLGVELLALDKELFTKARVHYEGRELKVSKPCPEIPLGALIVLVPTNGLFIWPAIRVGYQHRLRVNRDNNVTLTTLNMNPRVFSVKQFASRAETDLLIYNCMHQTNPVMRMARSGTGTESRKTGYTDGYEEGNIRTSDNAYDTSSPAAHRFFRRSFIVAGQPYEADRSDGVQVVRYKVGQAYGKHPDGFPTLPEFHHDISTGGANRVATVFVYVNSSADLLGGHTFFTHGAQPPGSLDAANEVVPPAVVALGKEEGQQLIEDLPQRWARKLSNECERASLNKGRGLSVPPVPGEAILFYNVDEFGRHTDMAEHAACPVLRGVKWGANLWVWNGPRYVQKSLADTKPNYYVDIDIWVESDNPAAVSVYWNGNKWGPLRRGKNFLQLWDGVLLKVTKKGETVREEKLKGGKRIKVKV